MRNDCIPDVNGPLVETIVTIDFPGGTFSDHGRRVLNIGDIYIKLGSASNSVSLTLDNSDQFGPRIESLFSIDAPPHNSEVNIYLSVNGRTFPLFSGIISNVSDWTKESISFDALSYSERYSRLIGTLLSKDDYPDLPEDSVGKIYPWIWGAISGFTPVRVDENKVTSLTQSVLSDDDYLEVESTEDFPETGTLKINDERISYTVKTDTRFGSAASPITRGVGSTDPGSHGAGDEVIEYGQAVWVISKHALTGVDEVRFVGRDGIEVIVDSSEYTLDLTGPSTITFDEEPTFDEPSGSHNLKIIDCDVDSGSSTGVDDPEHAAGLHADYDEYNYALVPESEYLQVKRDSSTEVVEPGGKLLRLWLVVEYWKDFTGSGAAVSFDGTSLGNLPDKSNTPEIIESDNTIHTMSAGFEDEHSHDLDNAIHQHTLSSGPNIIGPALDSGDENDDTWGSYPDAYSGDWSTYEDIFLTTIGIGAVNEIKFMQLRNPESLNVNRSIKKLRARMKFTKQAAGATAGATVTVSLYHPCTTGGTAKTIPIWSGSYTQFNALIVSEPVTYDTGWIDVEANHLTTRDSLNAYISVSVTPGSCSIRVYDMEVSYLLENEDVEDYTYEPVGSDNKGVPETYDLDWSSSAACTVAPVWTWASVSQPDQKIKKILVAVTGGTGTWTIYFGGTYRTFSASGLKTNFYSWDVSSMNKKGEDLLTGGSIYGGGSSSSPVVEVAAWVLYEDSYTGSTYLEDVGSSDEQSGNYSSLAWFELVDADGWQYPVGKNAKIAVTATDGEVKVLRVFYAGEFAPTEKRTGGQLLVDVEGRANTWTDILTDALTDSDLLGMPSSMVDLPTLSGTGNGAIVEREEGFGLIDAILTEALCHGFWNFENKFKVKARAKRDELPEAILSFDEVDTKSGGMKSFDWLANKIVAKYNYSFKDRKYADQIEVEDSASQSKYDKTQDFEIEFRFTRTESAAQAIAEHALSYKKECWITPEFEPSRLRGLNAEPGDLVSCGCDDLEAAKIEVDEVRVTGVADDYVTVKIAGTIF